MISSINKISNIHSFFKILYVVLAPGTKGRTEFTSAPCEETHSRESPPILVIPLANVGLSHIYHQQGHAIPGEKNGQQRARNELGRYRT